MSLEPSPLMVIRADRQSFNFSSKNAITLSSASRVGVAGLVDQVLGEDRVGGHRDPVGVSLRGVDLDPFEAIADLLAEPLKPLGRAEGIPGEAQAEDVHPFAGPAADALQLFGRDVEGAAAGPPQGERERGLGEHRSHDGGLHHEGEREVPGEAHPQRSHPLAPHLPVKLSGQGSQPLGDGAGAIGGQDGELPAHAGGGDLLPRVEVGEGLSRHPEHVGHEHREAGVGHPTGEAGHLGDDCPAPRASPAPRDPCLADRWSARLPGVTTRTARNRPTASTLSCRGYQVLFRFLLLPGRRDQEVVVAVLGRSSGRAAVRALRELEERPDPGLRPEKRPVRRRWRQPGRTSSCRTRSSLAARRRARRRSEGAISTAARSPKSSRT